MNNYERINEEAKHIFVGNGKYDLEYSGYKNEYAKNNTQRYVAFQRGPYYPDSHKYVQ